MLQANLSNSLPATSTLYRLISTNKDNVVEGEYRFPQLKDIKVKFNLPLCVCIRKVATRITNKIKYDPISKRIVGFVISFHNSLANVDAFLANSAYAIGTYFQENIKTDYAYVIMAKSLKD